MLLFRELLGLATDTRVKRRRSCPYSSPTSRPRKILATKHPPSWRTCEVMLMALSSSWPWTYSSMSCSPVTSGAPSQMTSSARWPWKCLMMLWAVSRLVMSPWMQCTPGRGAMGCRSTATIFTSSSSSPSPLLSSSLFCCCWSSPLLSSSSSAWINRSASTCDHEPGAAQRSTARRTQQEPSAAFLVPKKSNSSSNCRSLKADRARYPDSLARR
mmetsp:Transcript_17390/g.49785  ORF Transcript_17390/g.49785 Transcript_17390/m.49785 type:complete len:214 (+) Transcript_17390:552-1193(+)